MKPRPPISLVVFAGALLLGAAAAYLVWLDGLTLAHYDARGHLIVARRLTDSLTPGWKQLGALWLPWPHLVNAIPVMWDWNYRTGFSAVAINVVALASGLAALADFLHRRTGSRTATIGAALIVQLNPGVLYLTSTPMTEPMLFALGWLALNAADKRLDTPERHAPLAEPGPWMALAVLTRYEAWPVTALLTAMTAAARRSDRVRTFVRLAVWPAAAAAAFLLFGRLTLGRFFADAGFFRPDNPAADRPWLALGEIAKGYVDLAGAPVASLTVAGATLIAREVWRTRSLRPALPFALFASAALPFIAFLGGHPYRVRYMVALVAAGGALAGVALGALPRRVRLIGVTVAVAFAVLTRAPLSPAAPMTLEAQREAGAQGARAAITDYLAAHDDGRPILASMNSLGHYMQELSEIGLPLRRFLHAGNGDLWAAALRAPSRHAGWILIEEEAEGGDELAAIIRQRPEFLAGFDRVAAGGGAALYRLKPSF